MYKLAIDAVKISTESSYEILNLQESHFVDLKSIDIAPAKLSRSISAFANADGGELYIGIDEKTDGNSKVREWRGFKDFEAANGHLQIFETLFPLGQYFSYIFLQCEGSNGYVLKVEINKTREVINASDGKLYRRRGAQNLPVKSDEALSRLRLDKGLMSFETQTVDIDLQRVLESGVITNFMELVVPAAEPYTWLKKQLLIREEKLTVAGVLLFDEEPQAILPKRCAIKIYRYKTSEQEPSRDTLAFDPITVEGCLYDQIVESLKKTVKIVEGVKILTANGLENIEYPIETLHEIITNAVLHRDYSIASDIHVRIFDNRIEVESPGKLPGHITVENILYEQFARNGAIVRIINKFPGAPNKDVGEGLNTAFEAMINLKLKEPIIVEEANSVIVYIRHEPLASPEQIIIKYLEKNGEINNSKAREICHIGSENIVKRIFERMMKSNLIERIPEKKGKATAYRLKE